MCESHKLSVLTDLKNRGIQDCFIACVDGLTNFPEAIETVFPDTQVQLCEVRWVIYTTNAVESLNCPLRRVLKTHGAFPIGRALAQQLI